MESPFILASAFPYAEHRQILFLTSVPHSPFPKLPRAECRLPFPHSLFLLWRQGTTWQLQPTPFTGAGHILCSCYFKLPVFFKPLLLSTTRASNLGILIFRNFYQIRLCLQKLTLAMHSPILLMHSAFFSLNMKCLATFPKGFVVCGFHVMTPTSEGIDPMKTTH